MCDARSIQVPILVGRYAGKPELVSKIEAAVRVHQNNEVSVAASTALAKVHGLPLSPLQRSGPVHIPRRHL